MTSVTGATSSTVVTLSSSAENNAVTTAIKAKDAGRIGPGILAARIATY